MGITKERFSNKTIETTTVEVRRRDAGNWDAHFKGMANDGGDIHVVMNTTTFADLCDNHKHVDTLVYRFADNNNFGYWHVTYNKSRDDMPTIKAKHSKPFYAEHNS